MCSPSTEQFSTIAEFYTYAKKVVIDSAFKFDVSEIAALVETNAKFVGCQESLRAVGKCSSSR
jgi:hypothetical protein